MDTTDTRIDPARVRVTIDAQGIAEVAMVRADKMNALDAAMFHSLLGAIDRLRDDPAVRVVVLHGEGRAFCSGLDKSRFILCAADLTEEQAAGLSAMYDLSFVNLQTLGAHLQRLV